MEDSIKKINYNQNKKRLSVNLFDFSFIGYYKKSTRFSDIFENLITSIEHTDLKQEDFVIFNGKDFNVIDIDTRLKTIDFKKKNLEFGLKIHGTYIDENTNQRKEVEMAHRFSSPFKDVIQDFQKELNIKEKTYRIYAKGKDLTNDLVNLISKDFEEIYQDYSNNFEFVIKKKSEITTIFFVPGSEIKKIPFPIAPNIKLMDVMQSSFFNKIINMKKV